MSECAFIAIGIRAKILSGSLGLVDSTSHFDGVPVDSEDMQELLSVSVCG